MKSKSKKAKNPALSIAARQEQARERRRRLEEERVTKIREAAERKAARAEAEKALEEEKVCNTHSTSGCVGLILVMFRHGELMKRQRKRGR